MATLMFGKAVVTHSEVEIGKVQTIEYKVYKYLIGVAGFVTVASLRSEIESSKVLTRIMETIILFAKDILDGEFPKVKQYLETEIKKDKGSWIKKGTQGESKKGTQGGKSGNLDMGTRKGILESREKWNGQWIMYSMGYGI